MRKGGFGGFAGAGGGGGVLLRGAPAAWIASGMLRTIGGITR